MHAYFNKFNITQHNLIGKIFFSSFFVLWATFLCFGLTWVQTPPSWYIANWGEPIRSSTIESKMQPISYVYLVTLFHLTGGPGNFWAPGEQEVPVLQQTGSPAAGDWSTFKRSSLECRWVIGESDTRRKKNPIHQKPARCFDQFLRGGGGRARPPAAQRRSTPSATQSIPSDCAQDNWELKGQSAAEGNTLGAALGLIPFHEDIWSLLRTRINQRYQSSSSIIIIIINLTDVR